jgi:hypothetical protein
VGQGQGRRVWGPKSLSEVWHPPVHMLVDPKPSPANLAPAGPRALRADVKGGGGGESQPLCQGLTKLQTRRTGGGERGADSIGWPGHRGPEQRPWEAWDGRPAKRRHLEKEGV